MDMEDKIKEWLTVSINLKVLKKQEIELRKEIAEHILDGKIKGSKKAIIGNDTMIATGVASPKLDEDLLKTIWSDLSKKEKACIKFSPKLVNDEYKKLDEKSNLHRAVELKPGMPQLKIE